MKLFLTLSLVGTTLLSHFSQAFRLHPVVIAGLTTGMILTCSMTIAQSVTTGWLFNGQSTLNQITLNGIKYTGV